MTHRNLTPTDLLLDVLAVHRLTRLATADEISQDARDRTIEWAYERHGASNGYRSGTRYAAVQEEEGAVDLDIRGGWQELVEHDPEPPKLATLITCRWCASVWIAAAIVVVRRRRWWPAVRDLLALSSLSTLTAGLER